MSDQASWGLLTLCVKEKTASDGFIAIYYYNQILKKIIKHIKYGLVRKGLTELLKTIDPNKFGELLFYKKLSKAIYFQPIPLHEKRMRVRGFNQSGTASQFIS